MSVKICFLSLHSQPYFFQDDNLHFASGGGKMLALIGKELSKENKNQIKSASGGGKKLAIIGKELSKKDFEISFITYGKELEKIKKIDNVKLISPYDIDEAKKLNTFKKILKIWNCCVKMDSDIYIYSNGSPVITALFCFLKRKKYIYWMASDLAARLKDIDNKKSLLKKISHFIDIKFADYIIVQNDYQKEIVKKIFKKKVMLLKNPLIIEKFTNDFQKKFNNKKILWVGHFSSIKQPELFIKLAKELPKYKFIMIGDKDFDNPKIFENIDKESKKIKNLKLIKFVSPDKIEKYYKESLILVNTSKSEGFPNVFLEAWTNYTPVISLNIDPDNVIKENQLGFHSKFFKQMKEDINILTKDINLAKKVAKNCRNYVDKYHNVNKISYQFENLIKNLLNNKKNS